MRRALDVFLNVCHLLVQNAMQTKGIDCASLLKTDTKERAIELQRFKQGTHCVATLLLTQTTRLVGGKKP